MSTDAFLGGQLTIRQPKTGYRAGLDAVFLAASVPDLGAHLKVLDAGAGVGTAGLCAAARCKQAQVTLLEREGALAALARENIEANGLEDRVRLVHAGIGDTASVFTGAGLLAGSYDVVVANPPYHSPRGGTRSPDALKAVSHVMDGGAMDGGAMDGVAMDAGLEPWARFMARMAAPGGVALMVHRADALGPVLAALSKRFGALTILPLYPRAGQPANRILVRGIKGSRAPVSLLAGFVLHEEGSNSFVAEADAILRSGAALTRWPKPGTGRSGKAGR